MKPIRPTIEAPPSTQNTWLVSACLLGRACRYDGQSKGQIDVQRWLERRNKAGDTIVPICPEELGELGTPRPAAELRGGDGAAVWTGAARVQQVMSDADVTDAFKLGARRALAHAPQADGAVLKARSPSCGVGQTHIDGALQPGDGVFAALLRGRGVALCTDETLFEQAWPNTNTDAPAAGQRDT